MLSGDVFGPYLLLHMFRNVPLNDCPGEEKGRGGWVELRRRRGVWVEEERCVGGGEERWVGGWKVGEVGG